MKTENITIPERLSLEFANKIQTGQWNVDERIPTELHLARQYRASRNTIRSALKILEQRGMLVAGQGSGRRVAASNGIRRARLGLLARGGEFFAGSGQGEQYFAAIDRTVAELGHSLIVYSLNHQKHTLTDEGKGAIINWDELDGLMVFARQYHLSDIERLAPCLPVVAVTHDASSVQVPSFFIDYSALCAMAVQELASRGHTSIALLQGRLPSHRRLMSDIRRGYDLGRYVTGLKDAPSIILYFDDNPQSYEQLLAKLRQHEDRPTALISYYGTPWSHLLKAKDDRGTQSTEFDAISLGDLTGCPDVPADLAYFSCPIDQIGRDAVLCLTKMLANETPQELCNPYYGRLVSSSD